MQIVYKVVRVYQGTYYSITRDESNVYSLQYKIGKRAFSDVGKLFVFKELSRAKKFAELFEEKTCILRCETEDTPELAFWRLNTGRLVDKIVVENFWALGFEKLEDLGFTGLRNPPPETYLVNSLTPVGIVECFF